MNRILLRENLKNPISRQDIVREYCRGKKVLDIGCVQHDIEHESSGDWLHKIIVEVAEETLGVDYLPNAVEELNARGYKVVVGDVNQRLDIEEKFDVIVVGNLIEHLSNFEGLLLNIKRLLNPGGVALISTANPFFREQYFYSAYKNDIVVNSEHTCWIDPVTLDQLVVRFGMETEKVLWVKGGWKLSETIFNGDKQRLNNFTGGWDFLEERSFIEKLIIPIVRTVFDILVDSDRKKRLVKRFGDDLERIIYIKFKGVFVDFYWRVRRTFIPSSDINRHELYMSVLKLSDV